MAIDVETVAQQAISSWDGQIVVPFSETLLSGAGQTVRPNELLWYKRKNYLTGWMTSDLFCI